MVAVETTTIGSMPVISLEERRDTLYARLETGYATIERSAQAGEDVARWEKAWIRLLQEYEDVCDQIALRSETAPVSLH